MIFHSKRMVVVKKPSNSGSMVQGPPIAANFSQFRFRDLFRELRSDFLSGIKL